MWGGGPSSFQFLLGATVAWEPASLMALALASWPRDVSAPGSLACAPLQITMGVVLSGGRRQELGLLTDC